jgi:hypothetical protein
MTRWFFALFALALSGAQAAWTPPAKPDPAQILKEARGDRAAGRYDDALAKHLWYHQNALKIQPAQYGIRLSFALSEWADLARTYPQAMEALQATRRDAAARVRASGGREDFADYAAISHYLGEEAATAELFAWLDQNNPKLAAEVYPVAEEALIERKQYRLCGKYLDSTRATQDILDVHRSVLERADPELRRFAEAAFSRKAATLVALLAINGRNAEADKVMAAMLKEWPSDRLRKDLAKARKGVMPRRGLPAA